MASTITMTSKWARWRLKSPASRLFTELFIQTQIKENIKSSASLAFVRGIHRGPVNSPHKWPVTRKMFPFDDVIMWYLLIRSCRELQTIRKNPFCFQNCPEENTTIRSVVAVITNKGRTQYVCILCDFYALNGNVRWELPWTLWGDCNS